MHDRRQGDLVGLGVDDRRQATLAVYGSDPLGLWLGGAIMLVLSITPFSLATLLFHVSSGTGHVIWPPVVMTAIGGVAAVGGGLLAWSGAVRGVPRLTVTAAGVRFASLVGVQWVEWGSMTEFALSTTFTPRGVRLPAAIAYVTGPGCSSNLRDKTEFVVKDFFQSAMPTIVDDLNRMRPSLPKRPGAATVASPPSDPGLRGSHPVGRQKSRWALIVLLVFAVLLSVLCLWVSSLAYRSR